MFSMVAHSTVFISGMYEVSKGLGSMFNGSTETAQPAFRMQSHSHGCQRILVNAFRKIVLNIKKFSISKSKV